MAPSSEDIGQVVSAWLRSHPKARAIPISMLDNRGISDPESAPSAYFVYVWLVDGEEVLNLVLVKNGCCPGGTMESAVTNILVPEKEYAEFVRKVAAAEESAKRSKLGIWGTRGQLVEEHQKNAKEYKAQKEYEKAISELEQVVDLTPDADHEYTWLDIAKCHDALGNYKAALEAYDKAIGDRWRYPPLLAKAHCISKHEGPDAGVKWFRELMEKNPNDSKYHYLLGSFHMEEGRYRNAVDPFLKHIEAVCKEEGFQFDEKHSLILDERTLQKEDNDFGKLLPVLKYTAKSYLKLEGYDHALRYATMGVSIGRQLNRCKGCYGEKEVEAGDVDCRLVRAYVFIHQGRFAEAKAEIDAAKPLADYSSYEGWKNAIKKSYENLEKARSKHPGQEK